MALVRDGKLVWSGAYGYAERTPERRMTDDAIFRAESISKSVTAWGVMRLVQQGRVDLDAPVAQYLNGLKIPRSTEVTVRRVLSHNAGLARGTIGEEYAPQSAMPSLRDYLAREVRVTQEPGTGFAYSNVGFNLLELLIEEVTGRTFATYMAEEVLMPLGMRRSRFAWTATLQSSMPMGYDLRGTPVPPYVYPASASGGLFAPVEDIARFVCAGMTGPYYAENGVLTPESLRALHTPQVEVPGLFGLVADGYGFGHFIETLPDGRRAVWHGGQGHGWMTHYHMVPETGDGIVILTNSERSWPLMARVLDDWARWSGVGAVKFGQIVHATTALWGLIGLAGLALLVQAYRLIHGWRRGRRRWAPRSRTSRMVRGLQATLGLGILAALVWSVLQPYLFVASIFPRAAPWAGRIAFLWALVLLLSALLPPVAAPAERR